MFAKTRRILLFATCALFVTVTSRSLEARNDLVLGASGNTFLDDGTPRFLVFASYFDALDVSNGNLHSDFAYLKSKGVDGVRVFPNWWGMTEPYPGVKHYAQDTVIDENGDLRVGPLANLLDVLDIARYEGLYVDLSFSAESVGYCGSEPCYAFPTGSNIASLTQAELRAALVELAAELCAGGSAYKHVLVDIQNESNIVGPSDGLLDDENDVDDIAEGIHGEFSTMLVTISFSGDDTAATAAAFAEAAELDVATWHEERIASWWNYTATWVGDMQWETGKPIYLQEPAPYGHIRWTREGIEDNLEAAIEAGAAAWCFHTRASQYLNGTSLEDELANDEKDFLDELADIVYRTTWGA